MAGGGSAGAARRLDGQGLDSLPWLAYASPEHGGRVFWMHAENGQKTWAQPQPPTAHLTEVLTASGLAAAPSAKLAARDNGLDHICWVCTHSFGSDMPECKTISGQPPSAEDMVRTIEQIAPEFLRYPSGFPSKAGLDRIIFCSRLHYGGQRRGHVPSFHSRTMYIDCQRQPKRRAVSSFHHELWHFADYTMLGRDYEFGDSEWCAARGQRAAGRARRGDTRASAPCRARWPRSRWHIRRASPPVAHAACVSGSRAMRSARAGACLVAVAAQAAAQPGGLPVRQGWRRDAQRGLDLGIHRLRAERRLPQPVLDRVGRGGQGGGVGGADDGHAAARDVADARAQARAAQAALRAAARGDALARAVGAAPSRAGGGAPRG